MKRLRLAVVAVSCFLLGFSLGAFNGYRSCERDVALMLSRMGLIDDSLVDANKISAIGGAVSMVMVAGHKIHHLGH